MVKKLADIRVEPAIRRMPAQATKASRSRGSAGGIAMQV